MSLSKVGSVVVSLKSFNLLNVIIFLSINCISKSFPTAVFNICSYSLIYSVCSEVYILSYWKLHFGLTWDWNHWALCNILYVFSIYVKGWSVGISYNSLVQESRKLSWIFSNVSASWICLMDITAKRCLHPCAMFIFIACIERVSSYE